MNSVTRSELYRIRKTSGTYIVSLVLALLSVAGLLIMVLAHHFFSDSISLSPDDYDTFMAGFTTYAGGTCVKMLLVLYVGSTVIRAYSSGAMKQLVSCGISRKNIILGQFRGYTMALSVMTLILALISGACNLVYGRFGTYNIVHLVLSIVGTIVTVAFLTALTMLLAHLTANLAATFAACAAVLLGGGMAMLSLSFMTNIDAFNDYWFDSLQSNATSLDVSLIKQVSSIAIIFVVTILLVVITSVIFNKKDIK